VYGLSGMGGIRLTNTRSPTRAETPQAEQRSRGAFAALSAAHFLSYASYNALTPVLALYLVAQGHDAAFVGITIAAFSVTSVIVRPLAGAIVDRATKPRVYAAGALVLGLASLGYLITSVAAILASRVVQGGAWAVLNTTAPAMAIELAPPSQRGRAIGLLNMIRSIALPVAPPVALGLLSIAGFPAVLALTAAAGVLASAFIWTVPAVPSPAMASRPSLRALIERTALLPAALESLVYMTAPLYFAFLPLRAIELGIAEVGVVYLAGGITMVVVQPLGRLSDHWGRLPSTAIGFAAASIGLVVFSVATDLVALTVAGVLWAAGASFVEPATTAMAVDRAPADRRGAALATYTSAFQVGNAVGATAWGTVIAMFGFAPAFGLGSAVAAVGLVTVGSIFVRDARMRAAREATS